MSVLVTYDQYCEHDKEGNFKVREFISLSFFLTQTFLHPKYYDIFGEEVLVAKDISWLSLPGYNKVLFILIKIEIVKTHPY